MLSACKFLLLALAVLSVFALSGCVAEIGHSGPTQTETRTIELDKSDLVRVELKMGAGELSVRGGSPNLMDGEFTYNRPSSKPYVNYNASGFRGTLRVEEPSGTHTGTTKYRWDVRLNDTKPLDLRVDFGAGEGRLDLGTLNLRSVDVHMGVGQLRVDLRGMPQNDYNVDLRGGVGEVTVYLPRDVGIVAEAHGGIGGISARGLDKRDGRYTNAAYGHAKTTVRLDIKGGIGAINLLGGD